SVSSSRHSPRPPGRGASGRSPSCPPRRPWPPIFCRACSFLVHTFHGHTVAVHHRGDQPAFFVVLLHRPLQEVVLIVAFALLYLSLQHALHVIPCTAVRPQFHRYLGPGAGGIPFGDGAVALAVLIGLLAFRLLVVPVFGEGTVLVLLPDEPALGVKHLHVYRAGLVVVGPTAIAGTVHRAPLDLF